MEEEEKKGDPNAWALTYGDMITLLMTFFVLIIAMSSSKNDNVVEKINSADGLGENFLVADLEDAGIFEANVVSRPKTIVEAEDLPPPISNLDLIREGLVLFVTDNELFDVIDLMKTKEGYVVRIKADILFDTGEATLKSENIYILDKIGELLSVIQNSVRIEGHTDDKYYDDYDKGNRLSILRASAICGYFTEDEALMSSRFGVAGFGSYRPVFSNSSEHNRAKNRRVEIIIKELPKNG